MKLLADLPAHARGTFPGRNIMTPTVLGYARCTVGGKFAWAELSSGRGLSPGTTIYGVTFRRPGGGELWREGPGIDPSGCYHSRHKAEEQIKTYLEEPTP